MDKSSKQVGVALIGVTGYGESHIKSILAAQEAGVCRWVAAYDRDPQRLAQQADVLDEHGVRRFDDLGTMLAAVGDEVQLVGVPVGIPYHAELSIRCMEAGFHVICEKPPAPTIQDLDAMIAASARTGRCCAIGFQRSWSKAAQQTHRLICDGVLGEIRSVQVAACWKRADTYYTRNNWAGKLRADGRWVLDGTITNPFAHQIQAALELASTDKDRPTEPVRVRAELYRCRDITGDDTSSVAIEAVNGAMIYAHFTLCTEAPSQGPIHMRVVGENGTIEGADSRSLCVKLNDGRTLPIEPNDVDPRLLIYRDTCRFILTDEPPLRCPVAKTRPFVLAVDGAFESNGCPRAVDAKFLRTEPFRDATARCLEGVDEAIARGFQTGELFSELGLPWARPSKWFELGDYSRFEPSF